MNGTNSLSSKIYTIVTLTSLNLLDYPIVKFQDFNQILVDFNQFSLCFPVVNKKLVQLVQTHTHVIHRCDDVKIEADMHGYCHSDAYNCPESSNLLTEKYEWETEWRLINVVWHSVN